jgi:hypothetical protein
MNMTPIVVAMDVTRSRGDDSRVIYAKLPMFIGQIELRNYVPGPAISFAAIGDATSGDRAPLQVGQFEADNRLDDVLSKIWLEEGGGGSGQESYELAAYYYARHTKLAAPSAARRASSSSSATRASTRRSTSPRSSRSSKPLIEIVLHVDSPNDASLGDTASFESSCAIRPGYVPE